MKPQTWKTIRTTVEDTGLPSYLEKMVHWVERHPRAIAAGALVLVMAVALSQTPETPAEQDAYNGETPLFV